ncbi:TIGR03668 family PPOX class F420-dependent oxidoreductase [Fodinicola acaciae]|uniref:TIGR03668 family PPOX class F420-dependent oxidoreductase n=1 Tax=Fodinicola acaciae TaxID=2681555 RepID=UPI0016525A72|nr:TIGR03668 family PPOX class F420-dependent oxidoreductase [Fodinicola acaciae]
MRLTSEESRRRFAAARVARMATAAGDRPLLVPVTFAVSPDDMADVVYVAVDHKPKSTRRLRRLEHIEANPSVCFLADVYDDDWERLWWSRADCTATVTDSSAEAVELLAAKYPQYARTPPAGPYIVARVDAWHGWSYAG